MDTQKLTLKTYVGRGGHSNMAFLDQYLIATDEMSGPTATQEKERVGSQTLYFAPEDLERDRVFEPC